MFTSTFLDLSQMNPVQALLSCFLRTGFGIILSSTHNYSKLSPSFLVLTKIPYIFLFFPVRSTLPDHLMLLYNVRITIRSKDISSCFSCSIDVAFIERMFYIFGKYYYAPTDSVYVKMFTHQLKVLHFVTTVIFGVKNYYSSCRYIFCPPLSLCCLFHLSCPSILLSEYQILT